MLHQLLKLLPLLVDVELGVPQSIHQHSVVHLVQHHLRVQLRAEPAGRRQHQQLGTDTEVTRHQPAKQDTSIRQLPLPDPWSVRLAEQRPSPSFKARHTQG